MLMRQNSGMSIIDNNTEESVDISIVSNYVCLNATVSEETM